MENKKFIVIVIVICLLISGMVWQQVNIVGIKLQLIGLESSGVNGIKSTLISLAEIESKLDLNEKTQEIAQNDMFMDFTLSMYFLATDNWDQATSYLDLYGALNDTMTSLLTEHDGLVAQKIALLKG